MTRFKNILASRPIRIIALSTVALASLIALPGSARADDDRRSRSRDWREHSRDRRDHHDRDDHRHSHQNDTRTDVHVDINLGLPASRYEERTTRVWVEPVYRECIERVWIAPVTREDCERVWIPDRWETRETVVRGRYGRREVRCERVLVERGHYEDRRRTVVVCEGRWENVRRQELVSAGHWEYRSEHVRVEERGTWIDVFARLNR